MTPILYNNNCKEHLKQPINSERCECLTLRQLSLTFSMIIFVITAVLTTCAVLGNTHTQEVLELLKADIAEEQERSELFYGNNYSVSSNEAKLHVSEDFVIMMTKVLSICMWMGFINLASSAILIYGIAFSSSIYILPWILISGLTYLLVLTVEFLSYLNFITGIAVSLKILVVSLVAGIVYIQMWYTILCYCITLYGVRKAQYSSINPITINAYGGFKHTIQPMLIGTKPLV